MATYQTWSDCECAQLKDMAEHGESLASIARTLGRRLESVRHKARHMGIDLTVRKTRHYTADEDRRIMADGESIEELARELGRTADSVYARRRRLMREGQR